MSLPKIAPPEYGLSSCQVQPERRIDVSLIDDPTCGPSVVLRELSYGVGIGWYAQRSLQLDAQEADALLKALCCARSARSNREQTKAGSPKGSVTPPASEIPSGLRPRLVPSRSSQVD